MNEYKAGFPYLVDMCITSKCPFGCPMCYQSSTKNGADADAWIVGDTFRNMLLKANVLEVNFGGGEPTLVDQLDFILKRYKSTHFINGITTKNYNWHNSNKFKDCINSLNSVAISVNSVEDVRKSLPLHDAVEQNGASAYFQCVFGLLDYQKFQELIEVLPNHSNITLLGYKSFGFGTKMEPFKYPETWVKYVKNMAETKFLNVGVDSVMVARYKDLFIENGVAEMFLVGKEGSSTCYVDAVKKKMYPSSFSDHPGVRMEDKGFDFIREFRKF